MRAGLRVGVLGCGSYLPPQEVPNAEIAPAAGVTPDWIEQRTAIVSRRRSHTDEATSDLAVRAAEAALRDAGADPAQVSVVIVATSTPDSPQPPTACLVQHRLGIPAAVAFDVNAVCSGFVYALDTARRMIADGGLALVIGADVYSRILDPADRRTAVLFGDGAGAVVLGPVPDGRGVLGVRLTSYGALHDLIGVPAGGSRIPPSKDSLAAGLHYFRMNGRAVREFVEREVPAAVRDFCAGHGVAVDAIGHFVPHQANGRLIAGLADALGLPADRLHHTVQRYGNTGAASVPVTLAAGRNRIAAGDTVLLAAFGGGMTMGLALIRW